MQDSPTRRKSSHLVQVVSDGTGITGERVVRAALTQFEPELIDVERTPNVRDIEAITSAVAQAAGRRATILFSLVSPEHRRHLLEEARRLHVETIDLLGPILGRLSEVLQTSPHSEPGLFHQLDDEYFRRTEAIAFAVKHDDGRMIHEVDLAHLVIVGVSRTTKTPLSMLLAYRGWRVGNVPIIGGMEPPTELFDLPVRKVIGLTASAGWLVDVRRERARRMARGFEIAYDDLSHIKNELKWFHGIVARANWRVVDVTRKAIEETAAEIVELVRG
jgi:regulator of PEP synthase PpsR (kinase-PPPase family)